MGGGLSNKLSEGDIICVMSQWGEIEDINLVRDKITGKNKGYCFIKYYNQKSCILAVDNVNGMDLLGRVLHCDHVDQYKLPKELQETEEKNTNFNSNLKLSNNDGYNFNNDDFIFQEGSVYQEMKHANEFSITQGEDLWAPNKSISELENEI